MPGHKCVYYNCNISSSCTDAKIRMYRFPTSDPERLQQWIINSGNANLLHIEKELLRNRYICENHFTLDCFTNTTKNRLIKSAVPTQYVDITAQGESGPFKRHDSTLTPSTFEVIPVKDVYRPIFFD